MDTIDAYLAARCLLLADALERLDDLPPEAQERTLAEVVGLLELLAEAGAEQGDAAD